MTDIVEKLRTPDLGSYGDPHTVDSEIAAEAADEIERLRALVEDAWHEGCNSRWTEWEGSNALHELYNPPGTNND